MQKSPDNPPAAWLWRPREEILGAGIKVRVGGSFVFPPLSLPPSSSSLFSSQSAERCVDMSSVRRVVFVAGGVGVNPLMSMLSYIAENSGRFAGLEVNMAYGSKVPSRGRLGDILFMSRIAEIFGSGKVKTGSLRLFATGGHDASGNAVPLSGEGEERDDDRRGDGGLEDINGTKVDVRRRRISVQDVRDMIVGGRRSCDKVDDDDTYRKSTLVYICGPPMMTDEFVTELTASSSEEKRDGIRLDSRYILTEKWW